MVKETEEFLVIWLIVWIIVFTVLLIVCFVDSSIWRYRDSSMKLPPEHCSEYSRPLQGAAASGAGMREATQGILDDEK